MAVAPTQIFSGVFSVVYNLINSYVTDPNASTRNQTQGSTKWVFSAFPDADIENAKIKYPIIVIEPANASWTNWTLTKNIAPIIISFTVYATNMSVADGIFDQCNAVMDSQRTYLCSQGLHEVLLNLTDSDFVMRGGTRVHFRNATYNAVYRFSSGIAKSTHSSTIASDAVIAV